MKDPQEIKKEILKLTREYSRIVHASHRPGDDRGRKKWSLGDPIPYAGRVFTEDEVEVAVNSTLDFWLTLGSQGLSFQSEFAEFLGVKSSLLVNSGSSANLIALSTLTSWKLPDNRRIKRGDEVITVAAGFPTTVAPIIQIGAIPVFIDANSITGNANCKLLDKAYTLGKTKAVVLAHALGNPFDISNVLEFCIKHQLWLIEDNCDALGSTYSMPRSRAVSLGFSSNSPGLDEGPDRIVRWTGTWGDVSTQSFYPPHHLTTGEGGAVNIVKDKKLRIIAESYRDWGRDCWCPSGIDNTCNKRFEWQLGDLPKGYDHKYTYSHLGYNLKPLEIQAAIGRKQLKKLTSFINHRKYNWEYLRKGLADTSKYLDFSLPTHAISWNETNGFTWDSTGNRCCCSWFGFKIAIKKNAPFSRTELAQILDSNKIGNRMLFGGNLMRQPAFIQQIKDTPTCMRTATPLIESDAIMNNTLFLGVYPGLTKAMMDEEIRVIKNFISNY